MIRQSFIRAVPFGLIVSAALLLLSERALCEDPAKQDPISVTISELASHPREYDGKLVCVQAFVVSGWEGDNFLVEPSKPVPLDMPTQGDPAAVWFYATTNHEGDSAKIGQVRSRCHYFVGYFHFVDKPQIVNGVFDPGPLQLETLGSAVPDQQHHSLAEATRSKNIDEARRILHSDPALKDRYKNLLLFLAVDTNQIEFAEELLAVGADPRFTRAGGDTVLMAAAWRDDTKMARLLLDHGAVVNAKDSGGGTALTAAIHRCWDGKTGLPPEAAEAAKNDPDIQGRRDTFENCREGKMVQLLLDAGADPNMKTKNGTTALLGAAMEGNAAAAEALLKAGADPSSKSDGGFTPESESCDRGEAGKFRVCTLVREALKSMKSKNVHD